MRKVVVTEFMSLDGVMEEPRWAFKYWNDEIAKFKGEESSASDALLLGRFTHQGVAAAWPESKAVGAEYFNSVRKYVVSKTLEEPLEWNNSTLIKDNVVEESPNSSSRTVRTSRSTAAPRLYKRSFSTILWIAIGFLSTR